MKEYGLGSMIAPSGGVQFYNPTPDGYVAQQDLNLWKGNISTPTNTGLPNTGLANQAGTMYRQVGGTTTSANGLNSMSNFEKSQMRALDAYTRQMNEKANALAEQAKYQNSWIGGKGLAAIQGLGALYGMYNQYNAAKDQRKAFKQAYGMQKWNWEQAQREYARLQHQRESLTNAHQGKPTGKSWAEKSKNLKYKTA
ncbi:MAG: hypothetical protein KGV46_01605 [Pasteurella sp.]|nr:hypothetical protein [Pasteurella sp.]